MGLAAAPEVAVAGATLAVIAGAIVAGPLTGWLVLPGFLTTMLDGVLITNVADALGAKLDFGPIERNGKIALQARSSWTWQMRSSCRHSWRCPCSAENAGGVFLKPLINANVR